MEKKEAQSRSHRVWTIIGMVLCVILLPILVINSTLLIKSFTNEKAVPSFGGYMPMIVLSDSMSPGIKSGDLIICKTVSPQDVKTGDVISFYDPDGNGVSVVTHRVTEIAEQSGELIFYTKGDNNNAADLSPVQAEKLVGLYTGRRIAGAGNVAMFMQTTKGLLVCVGVPLLLFIGYDLLRRRSFEKRQKADTEELLAELEMLRSGQKKEA